MKHLSIKYLFISVLALFSITLSAQEAPAAATEPQISAEEFLQSLKPQSGNITLPNKVATIQLKEGFQYLSPESTEKLLVDAWGNPPGNETLGMIIPVSVSPLAENGWGVVITYDEDGYVSDEDADSIDYSELLGDMKEESVAVNEERKKQGYGSMLLVGWAEPPHYDKNTHKYYWAKEFSTDNAEENSLNYNIRILGRKGVLVLNAVAGMNQISTVKAQMPELLAVTEFTDGNRYQDFNAETDHVAEYGLAALVAGGVAAKMGFFAKIAAFFIAFKKFIIIGAVALFGLIGKLLGRKSNN
ncbi:MAG: hypothetical protein B0W54_15645 [Cellvibrio sp. 79]|nr:MAG: hypothetical protein B0W54_15645 [Cellvibrio sp. 79]